MTDAQKFGFYLPVWNQLAKQWHWNGARKLGITLAALLEVNEVSFRQWPEPAGPLMLQVITFARQIAAQRPPGGGANACGAVKLEDLRHGCNIVATAGSPGGPKISSKHFTTAETNRAVALMRLLVDPLSLKYISAWLNPQEADRRSLVEHVRTMAPEGTLRAIFNNAYHTKDWESGTAQQLVWLKRAIKGEVKRFHKPVRERERDRELEPF